MTAALPPFPSVRYVPLSTSNVRNIESLEALYGGMIHLASEWQKTIDEVRMLVHRAEECFAQDRPAYWRRQLQLAQRSRSEAQHELSIKQSAIRAEDRRPATEAVMRVRKADARVRLCEDKIRKAKAWSLEISRQCDELLGPLADVAQHCDVVLPTGASELRYLIEQLRLYTDHTDPS